ncbi:hypothetical protein WICPIJ_006929 [Wickerhamomyces pijperi]|uniref:Uncharacterized protein n=1 Tax=Wickerhamomyces pijperi TaxID=599730 RepID=A0A9P8TKF9_WICPI|nr:hypothetical protein WICPIJ_006929 [Wickerhamomyces pijperi]
MSRKNQDVKRQLFKNITGASPSKPSAPPSSPLDESASNLLSRTLRKQSDRLRSTHGSYISPHNQRYQKEFVIHKTTSPEQYKIFSSTHPIRESKLQALESAEKAFENLFHPDKQNMNFMTHSLNPNYSVYDSSSDEDDSEFPDISNLPQQSEYYDDQDDILLSVPGLSKEEMLALKKLHPRDRKNLKLPKQNSLEMAFSSQASLKYLRELSRDELEEYHILLKESEQEMFKLEAHDLRRKNDQRMFLNEIRKKVDFEDPDSMAIEMHHYQTIRETVASLETTNWIYNKRSL